jgi:Xaa-Pro aminopeptidase
VTGGPSRPRVRRSRLRALLLALPLALSAAPAAGQGQAPREAERWTVPSLPPLAPVPREEHARRRAALAAEMGDGVLVVFGAGEPENDYTGAGRGPALRYLTGITEPGAALVVAKRGGEVRERVFVLPRDPAREVWQGTRMGVDGARALTGIAAAPAAGLDAAVDSLLGEGPSTLYTLGAGSGDDRPGRILSREEQLVRAIARRHPGVPTTALDGGLGRLRAAKSAGELDRIRRAVLVTVVALREAMRATAPGMAELEAQALVEATFRRNGAERPAFATIVGSGPNGTTLHHGAGERVMAAGELVVMDVGASYDGYAADVTRTLPVSGTFTPAQRELYEVVLAAQKAAEARVRPGATWQELNGAASDALAAGLARLGLMEAPDATYDCGGGECSQLRLFYLHALGHGIGLDVHDPDVSYQGPFRPGSVFTLEPGVYVRAGVLDHLPDTPRNRALAARLRPVVQRYAGTGVRIEDDYLVTAAGAERLSAGVPREPDAIERLMREESPWSRMRLPEVVEWARGTP